MGAAFPTIVTAMLVSLASGLIVASRASAEDASAQAECDRLAGAPRNIVDIDAAPAIAACERAVVAEPDSGRMAYQLGRALAAALRGADAIASYRKAGELGHVDAQFSLAARYERAGDYAEAGKWYRMAAEQGMALAQYNFGSLYAKGLGVAKDEAEAAKWYRWAAEGGYREAQRELGAMTFLGIGVKPDAAEAAKWLGEAAEQSPFKEHLQIRRLRDGEMLERLEKELPQIREQAEKGDVLTQLILGYLYDKGFGALQDHAEAAKWYRMAAEQGNERARVALAKLVNGGATPPYIQPE